MLFAIAVLAPLLGASIAGIFGRQIGDRGAQAVTITCMVVAACAGTASFIPFLTDEVVPDTISLGTWIDVEGFHVEWALRHDTLSAMMVAMVTFIATLIHIYSIGYMSHDATIPRFFSYLSLFSFAMLMLVTADNLVQLFFGWEGVGLASYLLIGYWYDRPPANRAAMKAATLTSHRQTTTVNVRLAMPWNCTMVFCIPSRIRNSWLTASRFRRIQSSVAWPAALDTVSMGVRPNSNSLAIATRSAALL